MKGIFGISYLSMLVAACQVTQEDSMKVSFSQVKTFLQDHDIHPGGKRIPFDYYKEVTEKFRDRFGGKAFAWMLDCFIPSGKAVAPGLEDSCSFYSLDADSWEDLEKDWKESFPG